MGGCRLDYNFNKGSAETRCCYMHLLFLGFVSSPTATAVNAVQDTRPANRMGSGAPAIRKTPFSQVIFKSNARCCSSILDVTYLSGSLAIYLEQREQDSDSVPFACLLCRSVFSPL